jgi:hypothetical protein
MKPAIRHEMEKILLEEIGYIPTNLWRRLLALLRKTETQQKGTT